MGQDISGMSNINDLSNDLPREKEEREHAELAAELLREQAAGQIPVEPRAAAPGEDVVMLVETISLPDEAGALSPEGIMLKEIGLESETPWYRSRWFFYTGAGLAGGAALAAATVILLRNRSTRKPRTPLGRAQHTLSHWSRQLGDQTGKLTNQASRLTSQIRKSSRKPGALAGSMNKLTDQAAKLTDQAQDQISQLTRRKSGSGLTFIPLQRRSSANAWIKQTQRQLSDLSHQVSDQINSVGSSLGTTTAQALDRTQESLEHIRHGVASGAARTGEGIQTGWKFSRNFTLGMVAGAVWAAIFTPQNGEATRQHLRAIFQTNKRHNH